MPIVSGKRYVFINKKSGTALDLDTRDNKSVQGWSRHGRPNQQWETIRQGNGWHIKNVAQGTYLGRDGVENGSRVRCTPAIYSWDFRDNDSPGYRIISTERFTVGKCVDLADGNRANGTPVQIWTSFPGNENQLWEAQQI